VIKQAALVDSLIMTELGDVTVCILLQLVQLLIILIRLWGFFLFRVALYIFIAVVMPFAVVADRVNLLLRTRGWGTYQPIAVVLGLLPYITFYFLPTHLFLSYLGLTTTTTTTTTSSSLTYSDSPSFSNNLVGLVMLLIEISNHISNISVSALLLARDLFLLTLAVMRTCLLVVM
jgi:hypothetical protein